MQGIEAIDPVFFVSDRPSLQLAPGFERQRMLDWHAYRIAQVPTDLAAHVRRIQLLGDGQDAVALADALLSLLLVLGGRGSSLRTHLLETVGSSLPKDHLDFLESWTCNPTTTSSTPPWRTRLAEWNTDVGTPLFGNPAA